MLYFPYQRDAKSFRFPLPNRIWKYHLKYPSLSVLAYLHYRRHRGLPGKATPEELADALDLKTDVIGPILEELVQQGLITPDLIPVSTNEKFFSLPDEVFHLDLGCAAIAIYAFLLYRENRKTYQCTLSYKTIGQAIGASNNTVRKYVLELEAAIASRVSAASRRVQALCAAFSEPDFQAAVHELLEIAELLKSREKQLLS